MWDNQNKSEMACVFASLILSENNLKISEDSLVKIFSAAGLKVENFWFHLFPNLVSAINFKELVGNSPSIQIQSSSILVKNQQGTNEKEEKSEILSEKESEEDMGFGLFD